MMRYCPECGTENEETANYCKSCGHSLADVNASPQPEHERTDTLPPETADPERVAASGGIPLAEDLDGEPGGERLLWKGKPSKIFAFWRGLTTRYRLTNERLQIIKGFISRRTEEIDLYRVADVGMGQSFSQRILGVGHVFVISDDRTNPDLRLEDVRNPTHVKDLVRAAARLERQRRRVLMREEV